MPDRDGSLYPQWQDPADRQSPAYVDHLIRLSELAAREPGQPLERTRLRWDPVIGLWKWCRGCGFPTNPDHFLPGALCCTQCDNLKRPDARYPLGYWSNPDDPDRMRTAWSIRARESPATAVVSVSCCPNAPAGRACPEHEHDDAFRLAVRLVYRAHGLPTLAYNAVHEYVGRLR